MLMIVFGAGCLLLSVLFHAASLLHLGLPLLYALLAIGVAVGAYFGLKPLIGAAEVGWVCMLAAFPFAMCGFFTYNGMPAERFLLAVIRSEILCPRTLSYHPQNLYAELLLDNSTMREVLTLD